MNTITSETYFKQKGLPDPYSKKAYRADIFGTILNLSELHPKWKEYLENENRVATLQSNPNVEKGHAAFYDIPNISKLLMSDGSAWTIEASSSEVKKLVNDTLLRLKEMCEEYEDFVDKKIELTSRYRANITIFVLAKTVFETIASLHNVYESLDTDPPEWSNLTEEKQLIFARACEKVIARKDDKDFNPTDFLVMINPIFNFADPVSYGGVFRGLFGTINSLSIYLPVKRTYKATYSEELTPKWDVKIEESIQKEGVSK